MTAVIPRIELTRMQPGRGAGSGVWDRSQQECHFGCHKYSAKTTISMEALGGITQEDRW